MKNDEGCKMNDEGWWFQAVEGFCFRTDRRTNDEQTFAIVESLLQLKISYIYYVEVTQVDCRPCDPRTLEPQNTGTLWPHTSSKLLIPPPPASSLLQPPNTSSYILFPPPPTLRVHPEMNYTQAWQSLLINGNESFENHWKTNSDAEHFVKIYFSLVNISGQYFFSQSPVSLQSVSSQSPVNLHSVFPSL